LAGPPSLRKRVPAGVADAALASLATFATGLVGVNGLDDVTRGVYAVFFTAFLAASVIPTQLVLIPAEARAAQGEELDRLGVMRSSMRLGSLAGLLGLIPVAVAVLVSMNTAETGQLVAFSITAGAVSIISPLQDHVRRMLHLAGHSWRAASMSGLQLAGVALALLVLWALDVPVEWLPFGALAAANVVSTAAGLYWGWRTAADRPRLVVLAADLIKAGRWLLVMALVPRLAFFVASVVITALADSEALGFAEAARLAAQPLYVLGLGLEAVVRPHVMVAAGASDRVAADRHRRIFYPLIGGTALMYIIWAGSDWVGNPVAYLVPSAYEVEWLVVVTVVATSLRTAILPHIAEMLGARVEKRLATVALTFTPIQIVTALTAGFTGAFARPLGNLIDYAGRLVAYERERTSIYREEPVE
jgi:hypothetical protein